MLGHFNKFESTFPLETPPSPSASSINFDIYQGADTPSAISDAGSSIEDDSEYQGSSGSEDEGQDDIPRTENKRETKPRRQARKQSRKKAGRKGQLKCDLCGHIQKNNRQPDLTRHMATHLDFSSFVCRGIHVGQSES